MADPNTPAEETPSFETDEVQASRSREQGLGVGARELAAQRDPGGVRTPDVDDATDEPGDGRGHGDAPDQSLGVQGAPD